MKGLIFVFLVCVCVTGILVTADENLVALHKSNSSQYNPDCLASGCHDTFLEGENSSDPSVPAIHHRMIVYVPGYNPQRGVSSATCQQCHRSVDLINKSAAALLKNVSPQNCVVCHSGSGPGKKLFM